MKIKTTKYILIVSTTLLTLTSCAEDSEPTTQRTTKHKIVFESEPIISSQDPDFNGWEHTKLFQTLPTLSLNQPDEYQPILTAALSSRSAAYIDVYIPNAPSDINGTCSNFSTSLTQSLDRPKGTGFLVGLNTLMTNHHVGGFDYHGDTYEFILSFDKGSSLTDWPIISGNNKLFYERLYRLGFSAFKPVSDFFSIENYTSTPAQFDRWSFKTARDYYGKDRHDNKTFDAILEVADSKCIDGTGLRILGPGMLFDWSILPYAKGSADEPKNGDLTYSAQVQSIRSRDQQGNYTGNNNHPTITTGLPYDDFPMSYTMLPGRIGVKQSDHQSSECGFNITYQNQIKTSLDATSGSSGSASFKFYLSQSVGPPDVVGGAWGIVSSILHPDNNDDYRAFGYNQTAQHTFPTNAVGVTLITNKMIEDVDLLNEVNDPSRDLYFPKPQTYPEIQGPLQNSSAPLVDNEPGGCIGKCSDEDIIDPKFLVDVNCYKGLHNTLGFTGSIYGSGIGVAGVPFKTRVTSNTSLDIMGNFGLVCAPWSSYPYTEFWNRVRFLIYDTFPATKWSSQHNHRNFSYRGHSFSRFYNANSYTEVDANLQPTSQKTFPFQNCPAGYVLKEVKILRTNGDFELLTQQNNYLNIPEDTIAGIEAIKCTKIYRESTGPNEAIIPLKPPFYDTYPTELKFDTRIGSNTPDQLYLKEGVWVGCDTDKHITGYTVSSLNPNKPIDRLKFKCSSNPLPLPKGINMCTIQERPIGAVKSLPTHNPSCIYGPGSSWGQPATCSF